MFIFKFLLACTDDKILSSAYKGEDEDWFKGGFFDKVHRIEWMFGWVRRRKD